MKKENETNFNVGKWKFLPGGWEKLGGEEIYVDAIYFRSFGPPITGVTVNFNPDGSVEFVGPLARKKYKEAAEEALTNDTEVQTMLVNLNQRN